MSRLATLPEGTRELCSRLTAALAHEETVNLAILFGSVATTRSTPNSDVDLAVDASPAECTGLSGRLSLAVGREVDVVSLEDPGVPLLQAIVSEGIPVFERRHGVAPQWRSHALSSLDTDSSWYARMSDAHFKRLVAGGRDG